MKEIIAFNGATVEVDTSKKAFQEAGLDEFHSGQEVVDIHGDEIIIEGIGFGLGDYSKTKVLWCRMVDDNFSYYYLLNRPFTS